MRGTKDGFLASTFHELCDGKGPTLTIVESEHGKIFGGFTSVSWSSLNGRYLPDPTAFVFSLT